MGVLGRLNPVLVLARARLRRGWRACLVLALLLGIVGGASLAAAIAARRAQTAYPRLLHETHALDALVGLVVPPPSADAFYRAIAARPEVLRAGRTPGIRILRVDQTGRIDYSLKSLAPLDGAILGDFGRSKVLAGRFPDPDNEAEVFINRPLAKRDGLHVGDTLDGYRAFLGAKNPAALTPADGVPVSLRVVGIGIEPSQLLADGSTPNSAIMFVTPAFMRLHPEAIDIVFAGVRLRNPATDMTSFADATARLAETLPGRPPGTPFIFTDLHDAEVRAQRAITPEALALALFAGVAALAALATIGQAFSRQAESWDSEARVLRAVGVTGAQLGGVELCVAACVGAVAASCAVVVAAATAVATPFGIGRLAEPHEGLALNLAWLGVGFALVALGMVAVAVPVVRRRSRTATVEPVALSTAGRNRAAGLPVIVSLGIHYAFGSGGRSGTRVRRALPTVTLAVATLALVLTFGVNLQRLVSTPRYYGQTWNAALDAEPFPIATTPARNLLAADPDVSSYAAGNSGVLQIGTTAITTLGIDPVPGGPYPTVIDGRPATGTNDIVLGTRTLNRLHRHIGDEVRVTIAGAPRTMRVVGRVVFPKFVLGAFQRPELGDGALVRAPLLAPSNATLENQYTFFLIRLRGGVDKAAALERLRSSIASLGPCPFGPCVVATQRPDDVASYRRVRATPLALSAFLAVLALGTLGHVLTTSVLRRRRDFAVLKTIGLRPAQVAGVVLWQAASISVVVVVLGGLLGTALGLRAWHLFASRIGTSTAAAIPFLTLVAGGAATLAVASLVATAPAAVARRTTVAAQLRSD